MARYGWNLNNVPRRNYGVGAPQIACRLCNNVFMNTQALIDHIETHMNTDPDHHVSSLSAPRRQPPPSFNVSGSGSGGGPVSLLTGQRVITNNNFNFPIPSPNMPINMNPNVYNNIMPSLIGNRNFVYNPNPNMIPPRTAMNMYSPFMAAMRNNNYTFGSQFFPFPNNFQVPRKFAMGEKKSDTTKPFLQKLDKPLIADSEFELNGHKRKRSEFEKLDLNLKL